MCVNECVRVGGSWPIRNLLGYLYEFSKDCIFQYNSCLYIYICFKYATIHLPGALDFDEFTDIFTDEVKDSNGESKEDFILRVSYVVLIGDVRIVEELQKTPFWRGANKWCAYRNIILKVR